MSGNGFFLSHLLSFDAVLKVKAAQGRDRYPFVSELPVEVHCALLHGQTCPVFERERAGQELYMLVTQLADHLSTCKRFAGPKSCPTYMLNFIVGKVQSLCNVLIWNILWGLHGGLGGPIPQHQSD